MPKVLPTVENPSGLHQMKTVHAAPTTAVLPCSSALANPPLALEPSLRAEGKLGLTSSNTSYFGFYMQQI